LLGIIGAVFRLLQLLNQNQRAYVPEVRFFRAKSSRPKIPAQTQLILGAKAPSSGTALQVICYTINPLRRALRASESLHDEK